MTRPIEAVVAEARKHLESTGRLNIAAFVSAYPEHAAELQELLPVMLTLHQEKRWQQAEANSKAFAAGLFAQLSENTAPATLGALFRQERAEAGISLEEQARRTGISAQALEALSRDATPLEAASNSTLKQKAAELGASFANLVKEVRRLTSLSNLFQGGVAGPVFTRDQETSTEEEQEALRDQVRRKSRKPPEGK